MRSRLSLVCLALIFLCAGSALAQFESGTVRGTARDQSGAAMANCTVTLETAGTSLTMKTTTSTTGDFQFVNVRLGTYRIRAEAAGFQKSVTEDFEVRTDSRQRVDVSLK